MTSPRLSTRATLTLGSGSDSCLVVKEELLCLLNGARVVDQSDGKIQRTVQVRLPLFYTGSPLEP
jgi:hypothetical protein